MSDPFLSSEDYSERAHTFYNEGRYEEALDVLRNGLELYPFSVDLHVGAAYARLARDEFAWARRSFEEALALDPDHEEALAGVGETLLKLGERAAALRCFDRILALGFREDHDLMLQVGRALFREAMIDHARGFFEIAVDCHADSSEAAACLGYSTHRLGDEDGSLYWLRRALDLDSTHAEARIYLGNLLYDRGEYEAALFHFERTSPVDHIDELAVWRLLELKKSIYRLPADDPELTPWSARLVELAENTDPTERLLAEVEATQTDGSIRDPRQLELFGTLLTELQGMQLRRNPSESHRVKTTGGVTYAGAWEEIVLQMKMDDRELSESSMDQYMRWIARRSRTETGLAIPITDAESFVRGAAAAGLLTIIR
ncbi:MAG: tetratricopeptide repeat protein [Gemmatimonadales bacterium]